MPSDFIMLHKIDMLTCLHEKLKICTGTHYTVHAEAISKEKVNRNVALNFFCQAPFFTTQSYYTEVSRVLTPKYWLYILRSIGITDLQ